MDISPYRPLALYYIKKADLLSQIGPGGELGIRTLGTCVHSISSAAPSTTRTTLQILKLLLCNTHLVRVTGLEPASLATHEPESCVFANFTIPAYM